MIRETEKRLLPGAACAVLFVHGILGSPAQFAPFRRIGPSAICFCRGMAVVRGISLRPPWRSGGSRPGGHLPSCAHGMRRS